MKAKIICMASAKGGSGKTVLTATFGQFLATINKKVLLIDTDASTNGLTLLYLKEVMTESELLISKKKRPLGVYQSWENEYEVECPEIVTLPSGVDIIPATYEFQNTETISLERYTTCLRLIKRKYTEKYDYIFLDAQAGSDLYAKIAMGRDMSDEVVIVSEYDPLSAAGIERLKGLFREDLTYDRTWILLNKMLPEFVKSFSDFMEVAKYLNPIPWNASVVKSYARRRLALDMDNVNEYTLAIMQVLRSMLGDELEVELKAWSNEKETKLLEPIQDRYKTLQLELDGITLLKERKIKKEKQQQSLKLGLVVSSIFLVGLFPFVAKYYNIPIFEYFRKILTRGDSFLITVFAVFFSLLTYFIKDFQRIFDKKSKQDGDEEYVTKRKMLIKKQIKELETLEKADINFLVQESERIARSNKLEGLKYYHKATYN